MVFFKVSFFFENAGERARANATLLMRCLRCAQFWVVLRRFLRAGAAAFCCSGDL